MQVNRSIERRPYFSSKPSKREILYKLILLALNFGFVLNWSPVNHRALIDRGLTRDNGDDLQVYYHANGQQPVQIDRVLSGLGTKSATVHFRLQARMSANTIDDISYSLMIGDAVSGSVMDNP